MDKNTEKKRVAGIVNEDYSNYKSRFIVWKSIHINFHMRTDVETCKTHLIPLHFIRKQLVWGLLSQAGLTVCCRLLIM